jgi:hypothetical protein
VVFVLKHLKHLKHFGSLSARFFLSSLFIYVSREEHKLRACENRVLRRIFVPEREEVTGSWRKLHTEEFHNLYS